MVLEFVFYYSSSLLIYEKILLKELDKSSLEGCLIKEDNILKFYIKSDDSKVLENFSNNLSLKLPHSIYLHNTEVNSVDNLPSNNQYILPKRKKIPLAFCPKCLKKVLDKSNKNYYNPFCQCDVCGYKVKGVNKNYQSEFKQIASLISKNNIIKINTFYGEYYIGKLDDKCNDISFDILSYDLASIEKYTHITQKELITLGAIEKPLISLKTNLKFKVKFESIKNELIRFKLADDFILLLLLEELYRLNIEFIFLSQDKIPYQDEFLIASYKQQLKPIECVVGTNNIIILSGNKSLPKFELTKKNVIPFVGAFNSVIKEHKLFDKTIVGLNLSKDYHNDILIYSKEIGFKEYLSLNFKFVSIKDIFNKISSDNNSLKLINNYKDKFPDNYKAILDIKFDEKELNTYKLWGVLAIILGYSSNHNLYTSAKILEEKALSYLGTRGPRIDYKIIKIDSKSFLDPLMIIRTAMTFKLAGADSLSLCYGVMESFIEFISGQLDDIKQNINHDVVVVTGSLLGNKHLFNKIDKEISVNHQLYFNKELPVDGINIQYGGDVPL